MTDTGTARPGSSADDALLDLLSELREAGYAFTTVTPATHGRVNGRSDRAEADDLRGIFGWSRPFRLEILPEAIASALRRAGMLAPDGDLHRSRVRVSTLDGELFLHSAFPTTGEDAVFFGPDTYRFARAIRAWSSPARTARIRRAVDIGAGAGPGAFVVAKLASPDARVDMVDINEEALRLARVNAASAGLRNVTAHRSDVLGGVSGEYDLIVSNPPYLNDPLERAYRHGGGPLGAKLSLRILRDAVGRLAPGGTLILYTGAAIVNGVDPFREAATGVLRDAGLRWTYEEADPDVFGEELDTDRYREADRIAAIVLTAEREE